MHTVCWAAAARGHQQVAAAGLFYIRKKKDKDKKDEEGEAERQRRKRRDAAAAAVQIERFARGEREYK